MGQIIIRIKKIVHLYKLKRMEQLKCIIIDDEEIPRLKAFSIIKKYAMFDILGMFESYELAQSLIEKNKIDILFLDIDLPNINGIEIRKKLATIPVCVFITSHPEFAVDSFEIDTLDFLVKPLTQERFNKTVQRIEEFFEMREKISVFESGFIDDYIVIKEGYEKVKIKLYNILYIEALKDYCVLVTKEKRHYVASNLGTLLKTQNFESFIRIHRSYAVQKQYIRNISPHNIKLANSTQLPIGERFKENLINVL